MLDDNDNWVDRGGGRSGTTSDGYALNAAEAANGATGRQGNGVTVGNLPSGFTIQPATGIVWMHVGRGADGGTRFTFEQVNGVDGTCGGS